MDPERDLDIARRRLLGWSPACPQIMPGLDLGRDLVLTRGANGLIDLARVDGAECLSQSLSVALTTLLGSDLFNTRFGFDGLNAMAEETDVVLMRERVRVSVIQVLRADPRVRRIVDVNLADGRLTGIVGSPDGSEPEVGADPRTLTVRVAFETVTGDQSTVDLGRVVPRA